MRNSIPIILYVEGFGVIYGGSALVTVKTNVTGKYFLCFRKKNEKKNITVSLLFDFFNFWLNFFTLWMLIDTNI